MDAAKQYFAGRHYAVSRLRAAHRDALEKLVFFNDEQWRLRAALLRSIELFGNPRLVERDGHVALEIDRRPEAQTLFVLRDADAGAHLSGVVVFTREQAALHVIYVGLDPDEAHGNGRQAFLFVEIFQLLRTIGRRIRGIEFIEFDQGPRRLRLAVADRQ
jgi:hypothetical protein